LLLIFKGLVLMLILWTWFLDSWNRPQIPRALAPAARRGNSHHRSRRVEGRNMRHQPL